MAINMVGLVNKYLLTQPYPRKGGMQPSLCSAGRGRLGVAVYCSRLARLATGAVVSSSRQISGTMTEPSQLAHQLPSSNCSLQMQQRIASVVGCGCLCMQRI